MMKNEKREQVMHASARAGKAADLGLEIVLSRRATALMSEGCSTNECSTALQPRGYNHTQAAADNPGHAAHLQWQMTAACSCSSSSLFFRLVFNTFTRSCRIQSKLTRGAK